MVIIYEWTRSNKKLYLQYMNKSQQYCVKHIFEIEWDMTEKWLKMNWKSCSFPVIDQYNMFSVIINKQDFMRFSGNSRSCQSWLFFHSDWVISSKMTISLMLMWKYESYSKRIFFQTFSLDVVWAEDRHFRNGRHKVLHFELFVKFVDVFVEHLVSRFDKLFFSGQIS